MTGEMPEWLNATNADYADYPEIPEEHYAGPDARPEVKIGVDAWRIAEELSDAMSRDPLVYQRAYALVTVVGIDKPGGPPDPLPRTAPVIRDLSPPAAVLRLTRHVKMIAPVKPTNAEAAENTNRRAAHLAPLPAKWREITPPQAIVAQFIAAGEWPGMGL